MIQYNTNFTTTKHKQEAATANCIHMLFINKLLNYVNMAANMIIIRLVYFKSQVYHCIVPSHLSYHAMLVPTVSLSAEESKQALLRTLPVKITTAADVLIKPAAHTHILWAQLPGAYYDGCS